MSGKNTKKYEVSETGFEEYSEKSINKSGTEDSSFIPQCKTAYKLNVSLKRLGSVQNVYCLGYMPRIKKEKQGR